MSTISCLIRSSYSALKFANKKPTPETLENNYKEFFTKILFLSFEFYEKR